MTTAEEQIAKQLAQDAARRERTARYETALLAIVAVDWPVNINGVSPQKIAQKALASSE